MWLKPKSSELFSGHICDSIASSSFSFFCVFHPKINCCYLTHIAAPSRARWWCVRPLHSWECFKCPRTEGTMESSENRTHERAKRTRREHKETTPQWYILMLFGCVRTLDDIRECSLSLAGVGMFTHKINPNKLSSRGIRFDTRRITAEKSSER